MISVTSRYRGYKRTSRARAGGNCPPDSRDEIESRGRGGVHNIYQWVPDTIPPQTAVKHRRRVQLPAAPRTHLIGVRALLRVVRVVKVEAEGLELAQALHAGDPARDLTQRRELWCAHKGRCAWAWPSAGKSKRVCPKSCARLRWLMPARSLFSARREHNTTERSPGSASSPLAAP